MIEKALEISGWMSETELAFLNTIAHSITADGKVVEIGSWKGRSTVAICEALKQKPEVEFYAVDTFEGDPEIWKDGYKEELDNDSIYKEFQKNTAEYGFLKIIRTTSNEASIQFADESLDWVFLDGDHSYDAVCNDVRAWFPKLKYGGLLSGHDYTKFAVGLAIKRLFKNVSVWDSIWYIRRNQRTPENYLIPALEVAGRRLLLHQKF
jgi:predicted O-methyltransferase YrrM